MSIRIDKEAYKFDAVILAAIVLLLILSAVLWGKLIYFCIPLIILGIGITLFLRETIRERGFPQKTIISPASGKIIRIEQVNEPEFIQEDVLKLSIFMSVLDEHINYAPVSGEVRYLRHQKGSFHKAYLDEASEVNEAQLIGIKHDQTKIMMKQVAGAIARRVVCRCKVGDKLEAGENLGLIRFGSRVDFYLPLDCQIKVKLGDKVAGAATIIGELK